MKNNYYLLLLFTTFCCMGVQCKEIEKTELEKLPTITAVGAQTFGCLINGEAFVREDGDILHGSYHNGRFRVYYEKSSQLGPGYSVNLTVNQYIFKEGTYRIPYTTIMNNNVFSVFFPNETAYNNEYLDTGYALIHIIRLDTINYFMAGTFDFIARDSWGANKYVAVQNGRFDLKYQ